MYQIGQIVNGEVSGIENYGIFLNFNDGYNGLIHISEITQEFVKDVNDYVTIGENIYAKVLEVNEETKQLKLSIKDINYRAKDESIEVIDLAKDFKSLKDSLPKWTEEKLDEIKKLG